jgi:ferredoxin
MMRVEVDLDKCTGHGICESIADDVFEVEMTALCGSTTTSGRRPTVTGCGRRSRNAPPRLCA